MTEKDMWVTLRQQLKDKCHITRIENAISFGTPDVHIGYRNTGLWVELKVAKKGDYFLIQPSQLAWHISRLRCGCYDAFFLVYDTNASWHLYSSGQVAQLIVPVGNTVRIVFDGIESKHTVILPGYLSNILEVMYDLVRRRDG